MMAEAVDVAGEIAMTVMNDANAGKFDYSRNRIYGEMHHFKEWHLSLLFILWSLCMKSKRNTKRYAILNSD